MIKMDLTVLIISYRSLEKLKTCLSTIGKKRRVLVIENSNDSSLKDSIEKEYKNSRVILNNSNLGYAKASNIGFKNINTNYALLLNTDVLIYEDQINNIEKEIKKLNDNFALASPVTNDLVDFIKNNRFDNYFNDQIPLIDPKKNITKVELIKGCSLVINLNKFNNREVFDSNYFFFFEEIDLCRKLKKKDENIYIFNQIVIEHKSAQGLDGKLDYKYSNFRNWNFFWGKFYYFKKHYGFIYSLLKHFSKLIRFGFNAVRFYYVSNDKYQKNKYRFLGLLNSIFNKNSSLSNKILED
jgi:N-acetylglucosaminyl-diphospho-decaprenol L-rhamnosyltransferase